MDKESQLDQLESEKSHFKRNATICYIAIAYLVYTSLKDFETAPIYFSIIMFAIILGIFLISVRSKKKEKELKVKIEQIREELGMNDPDYWDNFEKKYEQDKTSKKDKTSTK